MSHATHTVIVTAGRAVGEVPMVAALWRSFKDDLLTALRAHKANIVQRPQMGVAHGGQQGIWQGLVSEEACTFVALMAESHLFALRHDLTEIRKRYHQEAVGFLAIEGTAHYA